MVKIRAVLSDLDGCLVRAVEIHRIALNEALHQIAGMRIPKWQHDVNFNGLPTRTKLAMLVRIGSIREDQVEAIYIVKQNNTDRVLHETLRHDNAITNIGKYWKDTGLLVACVTNAIRRSATTMLTLCGIMPYVDYLVSNEDVEAPKPSPDGYLKAMKHFGLEPQECVIIEDAPRGFEAAVASRCPNIWHVKGVDDVHVKGFRQFMKEIQHDT